MIASRLVLYILSGLLFSLTVLASEGWTLDEADRFIAEYLRIRNIDPSGTRSEYFNSWNRLSEIANKVPVGERGDLAALFGAQVELQLYRETRQFEHLINAESYLSLFKPSLLRRGYNFSPTQLKGFLHRADVALYRRDFATASTLYQGLVETSNHTAISLKAQSRLQGLYNGTFDRFLPSEFLQVPRLRESDGILLSGERAKLVVLDPGHGGEDFGARKGEWLEEKTITLEIARRIKAELEQRYGYAVYITREDDVFLPLERRTALANIKQADAFISLHINASERHTGRGFEIYYLDNADDASSRKLAQRENGIVGGAQVDDLSFMLSDLIQSGKMEDSIVLAHTIEESVRRGVIVSDKKLRSLGVKKAPFFVLVGAHMPCVLLEMFFIDHPYESALLASETFRERVSQNVARGIYEYFSRQ